MSGKPVQIASFQDGRLHVDTEQFNRVLDKVGDRPMAVFSVNGPTRSGKSYLLGHFLRYLGYAKQGGDDWFDRQLPREFHWKNSAERQTIGIKMWSEPFMTSKNGQDIAILLLDTQGCFDDKTTTHQNSVIFALSCLLSSVLLFNVRNNVSEDILQLLQLFIGYAKMSNDQDNSETFSKLVFVVRDWSVPQDFAFGYHDDWVTAGGCSRRNFKKEKLDLKDDMTSKVQNIHHGILSSFSTVGCCLMPHPGMGLATEDRIDQLAADFQATIVDFVPRILKGDQMVTKKLGEHEITVQDLKTMVANWAEIFQNDRIPPVQNVKDSTAEIQNRTAASDALEFYMAGMRRIVSSEGMPMTELNSWHDLKKSAAIDLFRNGKRISHQKIQERFQEDLEMDIERAFDAFRESNNELLRMQRFRAESIEERDQMRDQISSDLIRNEIADLGVEGIDDVISGLVSLSSLRSHYIDGDENEIADQGSPLENFINRAEKLLSMLNISINPNFYVIFACIISLFLILHVFLFVLFLYYCQHFILIAILCFFVVDFCVKRENCRKQHHYDCTCRS